MLKLVALIVLLGLDTFAVSAALGLAGLAGRDRARIPIVFALFEAGMPLLGLGLGAPLGHAIGGGADYLAVAVLIVFGLFILVGSDAGQEERVAGLARAGGAGLLLLGVSISLDELAVGFTLGLLNAPVVPAIAAIAVQAFVVSQLGLRLGARLSERFREGAERLAGIALSGLGIALLVEKLAGCSDEKCA